MPDQIEWNFKLIAHHELAGFGGMGEGMSIQIAKDGRRIIWLAHESAPKNFTAVDVSDPRKPKVVTQNNKEALMTSGFQVPFQTVSNNTVTIQFKDAALKLVVTPHISNSGTVIMDVLVENATPDFSKSVQGNPSINTQKATTQVQVADGTTTAIGGILQTQSTEQKDSTPGVSKIPLIGWLFQHNAKSSQAQELVIFLTPRILR